MALQATPLKQPPKNIETILAGLHSRYEVGAKIGQGHHGEVYRGFDHLSEKEITMKRIAPSELGAAQNQERGVSPHQEMLNEDAGGRLNTKHVVRAQLDIHEGEQWLIMPYFDTFLSDLVEDRHYNMNVSSETFSFMKPFKKRHDAKSLSRRQLIDYGHHMVASIAEMHGDLKRVHGDLKLDHYAYAKQECSYFGQNNYPDGISPGRLALLDLGTSTPIKAYGFDGPVNVGIIHTRAPENYTQGATTASDVWGTAANFVKLGTGRYPFEGMDLPNLSNDEYEKEQKECTKSLPRPFNKLMHQALARNPSARPYKGQDFLKEYERAMQGRTALDKGNELFVKVAPSTLAIGGSLMLVMGTAALVPEPDPQEIGVPTAQSYTIDSYGEDIPKTLIYDRESPAPSSVEDVEIRGDYRRGIDRAERHNQHVRYFMKTYFETADILGDEYNNFRGAPISQDQWDLVTGSARFQLYSQDHFHLESYMLRDLVNHAVQATTVDNVVDLENALATTRIGSFETLKAIQQSTREGKTSNYSDYRDYIKPADRVFVDTWLTRIEAQELSKPSDVRIAYE